MSDKHIEELIPSWFAGTLDSDEREKVEQWKEASDENRQIFADFLRAWQGLEMLELMKKYDSHKAIQHVNSKIKKGITIRFLTFFQKAAAILILPLLAFTMWLTLEKFPQQSREAVIAWHTLETPAGMRSEIYLPYSTKVYLNSKTRLSHPIVFNNAIREVKLSGE